ncbi:MAG: hypothetical protein ABR570_15345 [Burkholderiales bacterium]
MRPIAVALGVGLSSGSALAEGPGTRLRTTPEVPQPRTLATPQAQDAGNACERLKDERRERCLAELRNAGIERRPIGPGSVGASSGAGTRATTGTAGGASLGSGAPR